MGFRLSPEAREYFDEVQSESTTGEFGSIWDSYYLSAMMGIKARERVPEDDEPGTEPFIDHVISRYDDQKYEIYGAMIMAEIERGAIPAEDHSEIRQLMLSILDSTDPSRLSEYGQRLLNCYAERGYQILSRQVLKPPNLDQFLIEYKAALDAA